MRTINLLEQQWGFDHISASKLVIYFMNFKSIHYKTEKIDFTLENHKFLQVVERY